MSYLNDFDSLDVELNTLDEDDDKVLIFDAYALLLFPVPYEPPDECGVDALLQYPPRGLTLLL